MSVILSVAVSTCGSHESLQKHKSLIISIVLWCNSVKYNPLWNDEQSYMIRTTGVASWNIYMNNLCSSGQKQDVAILFANRDTVFTTSFSLFTHDQIDLTLLFSNDISIRSELLIVFSRLQ